MRGAAKTDDRPLLQMGGRTFSPFSALNAGAMAAAAAVNAATSQFSVAALFALCGAVAILNWRRHRAAPGPLAFHVLVGCVFFELCGANLLTGGFGLPAHFAMGLVPAAAIMMGGLEAGWPWLVASILEVALVAGLQAAGVAFPAAPPASTVFALQTAGALVTLGATFLLAAGFELDRRRRDAQLLEALELARAADKAKSLFLANVSHELRTPMNGVLGMLNALLDAELAPAHQEQAQVAHSSAHSLLRLLNGLLDITKLEVASLELLQEPVDPVALVEDVVRLHAPVAARKSVELESIGPSGARVGASLDPLRLSQVVNNLVSNALKFTEEGRVLVQTKLTPQIDMVRVEIAVTDNGPGIGAEDLVRVFEPFAQVDDSSTRRHTGAGLGLTIARGLCQAMGGALTARSTPGEGSTFVATVLGPRADVSAPAPITSDVPSFEGARVLVAEDDAVNRLVISRLLQRRGLEVVMVEDGALAVDRARDEPFDLVLMDWHMPRMDGLAATQRIRAELGDGAARLPVVALTASSTRDDRSRCLEAGMDDFLSKPVLPAALDVALRRWVGKRRAGEG